MKTWVEPSPVYVPETLQEAVGGHPLVLQTLARRGFATVDAARSFLDPAAYQPAPPTDLPDMDRALERLQEAIRQGERICVWGDFDVDGQTATALLVSTLQDLGAAVDYHIPNRRTESHGLNLPRLKAILDDGVTLLLTCDTGITAHEPVAYARSRGVDVVITDHHDLPDTLPEAYAAINPKMLPEGHPLRALPGAGCAFKLAEALYGSANRPGDVERHLDLAALGIVADVAAQTGDTRYLLQRGLVALRCTERIGLQVMIDMAEIKPDWLTEEHIGFVLAPRLNALGRLADATVAVEFLTTQDRTRARTIATELEGLNAQRRLLCEQVTRGALAQIEQEPQLLDHAALVLSHPTWPAGVIGIVAGRLAEQYARPAILIATPPGELGRGSARSVEGCDINSALAAHRDLLAGFGGHPMAAGLTIDPEHIPAFRRALSRSVTAMMSAVPEPTLQIDGYVPLGDLSLELVAELERLAPFGPGNPALTLASKRLTVASQRTMGRGDEHRILVVEDEAGTAQRVVWWRGADWPLPEGCFDLAYAVRASDFRGQRDVQVVWVDARPIEEPVAKKAPRRSRLTIVDHRQAPHPRRLLDRLREASEVQIWSEGAARDEVGGRDRHEIGPTKALVIWTTPPGFREFGDVMENAAPETVYLFGIDPGLDQMATFMERLAGLVKYALNAKEGRTSLSALAAATAQRESTVRAGLAWLAARGHVTVVDHEGLLQLAAGDQAVRDDLPERAARLKALLEETAAYRVHWARAAQENLI